MFVSVEEFSKLQSKVDDLFKAVKSSHESSKGLKSKVQSIEVKYKKLEEDVINREDFDTLDGEIENLTADLIAVLVLSVEQQERVHEVIPEKDKRKRRFLKELKLQSNSDGIIVKGDNYRMSFSSGERKIIDLHPDLLRALKFLNKCCEHELNIPTYYLKEIFCSYIIL